MDRRYQKIEYTYGRPKKEQYTWLFHRLDDINGSQLYPSYKKLELAIQKKRVGKCVYNNAYDLLNDLEKVQASNTGEKRQRFKDLLSQFGDVDHTHLPNRAHLLSLKIQFTSPLDESLYNEVKKELEIWNTFKHMLSDNKFQTLLSQFGFSDGTWALRQAMNNIHLRKENWTLRRVNNVDLIKKLYDQVKKDLEKWKKFEDLLSQFNVDDDNSLPRGAQLMKEQMQNEEKLIDDLYKRVKTELNEWKLEV